MFHRVAELPGTQPRLALAHAIPVTPRVSDAKLSTIHCRKLHIVHPASNVQRHSR
jgi:hypothetical protein